MACAHCGTRVRSILLTQFLSELNKYEKFMYIKIRRTKPNWKLKTGHVYKHSEINPQFLKAGLELKYFRKTTKEEFLKYNPEFTKKETNDTLETIRSIKPLDKIKENVNTESNEQEFAIREKPKRGRPRKSEN